MPSGARRDPCLPYRTAFQQPAFQYRLRDREANAKAKVPVYHDRVCRALEQALHDHAHRALERNPAVPAMEQSADEETARQSVTPGADGLPPHRPSVYARPFRAVSNRLPA